MDENQLREVANALIRLTGKTKTTAAAEAEIGPSNANSWLNGSDRKLSLESQLALLNSLGVRFGVLRRDMLHEWVVKNDPTDIRLVLSIDQSHDLDENHIKITEPDDVEKPCSIIIDSPLGGAPVRIEVTRPLMTEMPVPIAKLIGFGKIEQQCSLELDDATIATQHKVKM